MIVLSSPRVAVYSDWYNDMHHRLLLPLTSTSLTLSGNNLPLFSDGLRRGAHMLAPEVHIWNARGVGPLGGGEHDGQGLHVNF